MTAAPGIVTSGTGPPNAVVEIQPGMNVQPVVLVDQNGNYLATSGSAATAGYLADLTGTVNVAAATAPTVGQVLTATGGSAATWQTNPAGFANPMTTGGDLIFESGAPAPARLAGNAGSAKTFLTSTGTGGTANAPVWGTITTTDVPFAALLSGAAFTGEVTVQTPVNASDAVTKAYADAIAQGLSVKPSVQEATAAALPANVYGNGSSGVGATLTGLSTGTLTVDGILVALGDRVLVQDEAAAANNGIYSCTVAGALGVAYVLTRATDMNTAAQIPGAFVFTEQGTANTGAGFTVASEGPFVIGTTAISWTQFSGAGEITAGTGLSKTGNTIGLMIPVTVADGGTGGTTATFAFGNLSPMTTLGDMLFENSTPAAARLAGNTSATKMFLTQTGNGTISANPAWGTIATTDLPPTVIPAVTAPGTTATLANTAAAAFASTSGGAAYTIILGSAPGCGGGVSQTVVLAAGGTTLSIAAPGSQTIGGGTVPYKLYTQGDRLVVMSDGSNWQVTDYAAADLTFTSTQTFTVPGGWTLIDASVLGGGAGGSGGGSPSSNIAQVGGPGGGAAIEARRTFSVTPGLVLTCTVGGAGGGGNGGAASGNAGTAGTAGGNSSISGSGVPTITSAGANPSGAPAASSTSNAGAVPWGNSSTIGASGATGASYYGASGGAATSAGSYPGGQPIGLASGAGGGGGPAGTATSQGGVAGSPGTPSGGGGAGASSGGAGSVNGGTASSAAAASYGAGGGGGGAGATNTGIGGPGGNGGPGVIILRRRG